MQLIRSAMQKGYQEHKPKRLYMGKVVLETSQVLWAHKHIKGLASIGYIGLGFDLVI